MRTANPTLNESVFTALGRTRSEEAMTLQGTVNKTAILLALALLSAGWTWNLYTASGDAAAVGPWLMVGAIFIACATACADSSAGMMPSARHSA